MPGAYGRRKVNLAHVVAVHTGCAGYFARAEDGSYRFHVFGFTADVEWAETLFFSLCHQAEAALGFNILHQMQTLWLVYFYASPPESGRPTLIPLALRGVTYRPLGAPAVLRRNLLVYGLGGLIVPFIGIKLIDVLVTALHLA